MIVAVPADTPVTVPLLLIVAIPGAELTHGLVVAGVPEPVKVKLFPIQPLFAPEMTGAPLTVTSTLLSHPALFVKVIVEVPAETPVTTPVLLTVATEGLLLIQGVAPGVPVAVRVVVFPTQMAVVPVICGIAKTVMVIVRVHPLLLVYVMMAVPAEIPVTTPVLLTVATPGLEETHGLTVAGVPEPINVVVLLIQIVLVPVMVGNALTVKFAVALVTPQLLVTASDMVWLPLVLYVMVPGVLVLELAGVPLVKVQLNVVAASI